MNNVNNKEAKISTLYGEEVKNENRDEPYDRLAILSYSDRLVTAPLLLPNHNHPHDKGVHP